MFNTQYHGLMARLRFRQLQLVSVLGYTGNMHEAAHQMTMTQPAASKMLKEIENLLGASLFDRRPSGMVPTKFGVAVIAYARELLAGAIDIIDEGRKLAAGGDGTLKIGAIMSAVVGPLPQAIAAIMRRRPLLSIRMFTGTSDLLIDALLQHRCDIVIGRRSDSTATSTIFRPLATEDICAFCSSTHPAIRHGEPSVEELLQYPWILQTISSPLRQALETFFEPFGGTPRNLIETTSVHASIHMVREAGMISVLPSALLALDFRAGHLYRLQVQLPDIGKYGIVTRNQEEEDVLISELVAALIECCELA